MPAFIGVLLIIAVLIEPYIIRRQVPARLWAWLRGQPPPPALEVGGVAIEGAQTKGAMATDRALTARGFGKFLARRDALAIMLTVILWMVGLYLRPDYWWHLPNTFAILLNYTELALIAVGLTYVIAAGDIDLSVGAVLALAGGAAAYSLKVLGLGPVEAIVIGLSVGLAAGAFNGIMTVAFGLPAFIATLGMFYIARGLASWIVAGQQLTGFTEGYNLIGRKLGDILTYMHIPRPSGLLGALADVVSVQTLWMILVSIIAGTVLAYMPFGQTRLRHRRQHPRRRLCRHQHQGASASSRSSSARFAPAWPALINIAYFRSFNPVAGQFRELDGIAAVIIGGGSIFGGYGTIIGALAGAAVITLVRALLQLNVQGFTMPQQWINVFIGAILIGAVLIDIWVRQANIIGRLRAYFAERRQTKPEPPMPEHQRARTDRRDARHRKSVRRGAGAARASTSSSIRARSSAWSATTRPANRR